MKTFGALLLMGTLASSSCMAYETTFDDSGLFVKISCKEGKESCGETLLRKSVIVSVEVAKLPPKAEQDPQKGQIVLRTIVRDGVENDGTFVNYRTYTYEFESYEQARNAAKKLTEALAHPDIERD